MRAGRQRYVSSAAVAVMYCLALALRLRDGGNLAILAACGLAVLLGWRFGYHRYVFPLVEGARIAKPDAEPDAEILAAAHRKYRATWVIVATVGIAVANVLWLV